MLPRKQRVSKAHFVGVSNIKGRLYHSPLFTLRVVKGSLGKPRFACIVSKKVAPRATSRNRLRRRFYAVLGEIRHPSQPLLLFFMIKAAAADASPAELRREVGRVLQETRNLS